jgi:hypothetical protein
MILINHLLATNYRKSQRRGAEAQRPQRFSFAFGLSENAATIQSPKIFAASASLRLCAGFSGNASAASNQARQVMSGSSGKIGRGTFR